MASSDERDSGKISNSLKRKRKVCKYTKDWEATFAWITNNETDRTNTTAYCKLCQKSFTNEYSGIKAVTQHARTKNHLYKEKIASSNKRINSFFSGKDSSSTAIRMEQLKDDSIAGTSDENPKEDGLSKGADQHSCMGQPQCVTKEDKEDINNERDFPGKVPTSLKDANKEEGKFLVTLGESGKKHLVRGRLTDSLFSALRSSRRVCDWMKRSKTKEFHLIEKRDRLNVCVNMGMPLKYVSDDSQFEMKSYKLTKNKNELWYRQYDNRKEECIVFYICGTGSRMESHGAQSRRLIKNQNLLKQTCIFCIFAPKGESIKDALCNDGRFLPLLKEMNWTLVKDGISIDNNFPVSDDLSKQVYEIEVETKKGARYSGDQNKKQNDLDLGGQQLSTLEKPQPRLDFEEGQLSASKKQQPESDCEQGQLSTSKKQQLQDFESQILQLYPKLMKERQNIEKILSGYKKDALEVYKRNFGKEVNDSFSFKLMKTLVKYGDSVGYIEWKDKLGCLKGAATCFVLRGRYILTCHHVITKIVGEEIERKDWGNIIKQLARVTFSYVEQHPTENWFLLENWFEIADEDLDFAVLKLEENESKSHPPPGLLHLHFPPPLKGPIFIIGHPNAGIKSTDICLAVSIFDRDSEFTNHFNKHKNTECRYPVCDYSETKKCIHMYNPKTIEEQRSNPNVVTYNTCFFQGSSGSPVFNQNGHLVALHAAGFGYKMRNKDCSLIEWGYSIHSINLKIKSQFKSWYDAVIGPDAREDSSHVDAPLHEAEEEMDCS